MAILNFADSDFVGKLNAWFDQTVDRASDSFTSSTHIVAVVVAFIVAFTVQLDTIGLINRLSTDHAVRAKLVDWAIKNEPQIDSKALEAQSGGDTTNAAAQPASNETTNATAAADAASAANAAAAGTLGVGNVDGPIMASARDELLNDKLLVLPASHQVWARRWSASVTCPDVAKLSGEPSANVAMVGDACPLPRVSLWGVLLSGFLLSLGGPFWYEALKNLLKLRSLIASKDDDQREDRQTNTAASESAPTVARAPAPTMPPAMNGGEAGNLKAFG